MRRKTKIFISTFLAASLFSAPLDIPTKNPFTEPLVHELAEQLKSIPTVKIYFTGNLYGATDICGCSALPQGGLERRYNFLKQKGFLEKELPADALLLDFGNMLFKSQLIESNLESAVSHALKIVEASTYFPYSAVNFGSFERTVPTARLKEILSKAKFPMLSTNFIPPKGFENLMQRRIPIKLKNANLMIYGLSYDDNEYAKREGWTYLNYATALKKELKDLAKDTFPIVLSDLSVNEVTSLQSTLKRPVLFLGSSNIEPARLPVEKGQLLLAQSAFEGREVGFVEFNPQNKKEGWFRPKDAKQIASQWDEIIKEMREVQTSKMSKEREQRIKALEKKMKTLTAWSPHKNNLSYNYERIVLNSAFDGKNPVSAYQVKK